MPHRRIMLTLLVALYGVATSFPCPDPAYAEDPEVRWVMSQPTAGEQVRADSSPEENPVMRMACPCGCRHAASAVAGVGVVQMLAPPWAELDPPSMDRFEIPRKLEAPSRRAERPDPIPKPSTRLS